MKKEVFYIKNNLLFSKNYDTFKIYKNFESINLLIENSNILKSNKKILKQLEDFKKNSIKEIKISGRIKKFDEVFTKIKKLPKPEFKKPILDDYEFIEKTSQIEIITQVIDSVEETNFEELKNKVHSYIKSNIDNEKDKIDSFQDLINSENNKIKIVDEKIKSLEELKINFLKKKNLNSKKKIENLIRKKLKLEEFLGQSEEREDIENKLEELDRKANSIKFKIEENKIDIKILKSKINSLNDSIKLGKKKTIQFIPFVLSLGFVYWTKYSDTNHVRNTYHLKLNKKNETELLLEKRLHKIQNEIEEKKRESKKVFVKISKKQEQINKDIEDCEIEIKNEEKDNKKIEKKLEKELSEIERIEKEKQVFIDKKREYEMIIGEYNKNSLENIRKNIEEIEEHRKENISNLKNIKKTIMSQKIEKKGEWIVEV